LIIEKRLDYEIYDETKPTAFIPLIKEIFKLEGFNYIYRGQGFDRPLAPKISRDDEYLESNRGIIPRNKSSSDNEEIDLITEKEHIALNELKRRIPLLRNSELNLDYERPESLWNVFIIAQHYGLQTRLLDFSYNPLVAAFFASNSHPNDDGVIWCIDADTDNYRVLEQLYSIDYTGIIEDGESYLFLPPFLDIRIRVQQSVLVYFTDPYTPLESQKSFLNSTNPHPLVRIKIPHNFKHNLLNHLHQVGIDNESLFPDISGSMAHLDWLLKKVN